MTRRNVWITIGAVVVIAIVAVGIWQSRKPEGKVIKIGAILPLTGKLSAMGQAERNAINLALEEEGLKNVEVTFYDSQGDPSTAISNIQRATAIDGIRFFLCSLSGVSMALKEWLEKEKRVDGFLGAVAFHPNLTKNAERTLRFIYDGRAEARLIVKYLKDSKPTSVFVLASQTPLEELEVKDVILPQLRSSGIQAKVEWFEFGAKDFRAQVAKLKAQSPSHVVILGYGSDIKLLLAQMGAAEALDHSIIGGIGFLELRKGVPYEIVKGIKFVAPKFLIDEPRYAEISRRFREKYGQEMPYDAAYLYDATTVLAQVLGRVKTPAQARRYILQNAFQGITGRFRFDSEGNLVTDLVVASYSKDFRLEVLGQER